MILACSLSFGLLRNCSLPVSHVTNFKMFLGPAGTQAWFRFSCARCDMSYLSNAGRKRKGATHVVLPLCTEGCLYQALCALQTVLHDA